MKPSCKGGGERRPEEAAEEVDGATTSNVVAGECIFTCVRCMHMDRGDGC